KFGSTDCNFLATAAPELKDFRVFPNPVQSELFVSGFEQSHYAVYDVLGAQVLSGIVLAAGSIAVGSLSVGVYVLRLENAAGAVKVVKVVRE
ncbi:MAG: T9SS type A sorting domain-containing protein, partial [Burkholderiales bacterium]|nr:T9SS type A sorting domain-containing protein [Flavobacterium sp.]